LFSIVEHESLSKYFFLLCSVCMYVNMDMHIYVCVYV